MFAGEGQQQQWAAAADDDRISFEDSERFEEDSLCSWLSEPESICNNWRGWTGPSTSASRHSYLQTLTYNGGIAQGNIQQCSGSKVLSLVELCAQEVARAIPFEAVERLFPPVPENLQLRIAFWSFPDSEEDIRLYCCLANGNVDEFQKGEQLYRTHAVRDLLQIGFHLSASVHPQASLPSSTNAAGGINVVVDGGVVGSQRHQIGSFSFNVAVTLDRRKITSCTCTCNTSSAWCAHIVAVCLHRINQPHSACLRAPVSESLSRLNRDQLQKFAQYLISELPRQILPTAQKLLDELLSQATAINTLTGAPDPTAGASVLDDSNWCLDETALHRNIRKILEKFCVPSPTVLSDVNYLSSTAPPAATEWQSVLQPLVGRLPEGLWNLLSMVREMFRRHDRNATQLLSIITQECIASDQVVMWWYQTRISQALIGNQIVGTSLKNSLGNAATAQYSCAFLCDEIVLLWRLAALDPSHTTAERAALSSQLKEYHLKVIEKVSRILLYSSDLQQHHNHNNPNNGGGNANNVNNPQNSPNQVAAGVAIAVPPAVVSVSALPAAALKEVSPVAVRLAPNDPRRFDFDAFPGFKPAVEACFLSWDDYPLDGISSCHQHSKELSLRYSAGCLMKTSGSSDGGSACTIVVGNSAAGGGGSSGAVSPFSQGCLSPSLPVLRDKQFRNLSSLKQILLSGLTTSGATSAASSSSAIAQASSFPQTGDDSVLPQYRSNSIVSRSGLGKPATASSYPAMSAAACSAKVGVAKSVSLDDSAVNSSDESGHESGGTGSCYGQGAPLQGNKTGSAIGERRCSTPTSPLSVMEHFAELSPDKVFVGSALMAENKEKLLSINVADDLDEIYGNKFNANAASECKDGFADGSTARKSAGKNSSPVQVVEELFLTLGCVEDNFEIMFARAEALHCYGYIEEASKLAGQLSLLLLRNPPDFLSTFLQIAALPAALTPTKPGRRSRRGLDYPIFVHPLVYKNSHLAHAVLCKAWFLASVLMTNQKDQHLAFKVAMFGLELPRTPAATKFLEVKLNNQEMELIALLKKMPLTGVEIEMLRDRAHRLRNGTYSLQPLPVLPFSLASFLFETLCWSDDNFNPLRQVQDEALGFEAAVAALGLKPCVSEAENPLLCEGMRRQRGELALNLLLRYKDQPKKVAVIMDKLLDREMHQMYKNHQSNAAFYGFEDIDLIGGSSRAGLLGPSAKTVQRQKSAVDPRSAAVKLQRSYSGVSVVSYNAEGADEHDISGPFDDSSLMLRGVGDESFQERDEMSPLWDEMHLRDKVDAVEISSGLSGCDAASTDSSCSGLSRIPGAAHAAALPLLDQATACGSSAPASFGPPLQRTESPPTVAKISNASADIFGPNKSGQFKLPRNRRRVQPSQPNQPSEAQAHFLFELAKNLLTKAGGTHSTAIFSAGAHNHQPNGAIGPHRALHLCAFQIGLYALGLHNRVSPNWLSRTYSSHVSWISGQAMEIGKVALRLLIDTWENHLTPTEVANLADKASQGRDPAMVQAAAELALSALPQAHALNPTEIQRALVQCKEQNQAMLERACLAVENAAKDGGVYPEVLFMVARQWYSLYVESGGNEAANLNDASYQPQLQNSQPQMDAMQQQHQIAAAAFANNAMQLQHQQQQQQLPNMNINAGNCGLPMGQLFHPANQMPGSHLVQAMNNQPSMALPPPVGAGQMHHLVAAGHQMQQLQQQPQQQFHQVLHLQQQQQQQNQQQLHLALPNMPVLNSAPASASVGMFSYPMNAPPPQNNAPPPGVVAYPPHCTPMQFHQAGSSSTASSMQMSYSIQATFMANGTSSGAAAYPNHVVSMNGYPAALFPPPPTAPCHHQVGAVSNGGYVPVFVRPPPVLNHHLATPPPRLHPSHSAPNLAPHQHAMEELQQQDHIRCLYSAYRVGMLAMDTMGRRIHDDNRNYVKYAPNPPYGDDVKWLFKISKKLGMSFVQQFCYYTAMSVVSPFVLFDIAQETAMLVSRGTNPLAKALHPPHAQPHVQELVRKYIEMFELAAIQKLSHPKFTPSDAEELITLVRTARTAFNQVGAGHNFEVLLHSKIKKTKACKKDLWNRLLNALNS